MGVADKNESILNLDRQLREKVQRIEQVELNHVNFFKLIFERISQASN
jgi:hypothetical protein